MEGSKDEYFRNARASFLKECCLPIEDIYKVEFSALEVGMRVIHLRTRGKDDVICSYPGLPTIFKHVFLQNANFRQEVVNHYRAFGYAWVDIVPLDRRDWKIFLWLPRVRQSSKDN